MNRKVLVLGGTASSGLTVVRSLGRKSIQVHICWYPTDSIVPFSRYTKKTHTLPEYREDDSRWLNALIELLEREKFDLVIPTNDGSILPLIKERSTLENIVKLAIPDDQAFFCTYKKNKTAELCQCLGIPIPRQILVSNEIDLSEFDSGWKFPLVIKPVSSKVTKDTKIVSLYVSHANSKEQLLIKLKDLLQITPALVQEYFVGTGMGVELLADEGKTLCAFQHVRIHEPIHGGASFYRKSAPLNPKLLDCAKRLISALKWTGVAMVEFKYNKSTNEFVLIEINGRFWGSLPLAVAAGMDFPYYLYQLLVEDKKDFSAEYKTGVYCRNWYPDIRWFLRNLFTRPTKFNNAVPLWKLLYEPLNLVLMREHYDTFVLDDMRPGFYELKLLLKMLVTKLRNLFLIYWLKFPLAKKLMYKRMKKLGQCKSICFVCKGNICRSPFAEAYLKKLLVKLEKDTIRVSSAGYYKESGRTPPDNAIDAARHFQIELNTARSTIVSEVTMKEHDIVFVFDTHDYVTMTKKFKGYKSKIIFIGLFGKSSPIEIIQDPYGQDVEKFIQCYASIARLLDSLSQQKYGRAL